MEYNPIIRDTLAHPSNRWQQLQAGLFTVYHWPFNEPPNWLITSDTRHLPAANRAFMGRVSAARLDAVVSGLNQLQAWLGALGCFAQCNKPMDVILWDPLYPLPDAWELAVEVKPESPVMLPSDPPLILLFTHEPGERPLDGAMVASVALHEGFHAMIWQEIIRRDLPAMANWEKAEEMCALALEASLLGECGAFLSYGKAWQSSFALSIVDDDERLFNAERGDQDSPQRRADLESYGHFGFLAFLEFRGLTSGSHHWFRCLWETAFQYEGNAPYASWQAMDKALTKHGGLSVVFMAYLEESLFPETKIFERLHQECGEPAAIVMQRGMNYSIGLGSLAAQFYRLDVPANVAGGAVFVAERKAKSVTTKLYRVLRSINGIQGEQIDTLNHDGQIRVPLSKEAAEYLLVIAHPCLSPFVIAPIVRWL